MLIGPDQAIVLFHLAPVVVAESHPAIHLEPADVGSGGPSIHLVVSNRLGACDRCESQSRKASRQNEEVS
jgi:hypothetical protein